MILAIDVHYKDNSANAVAGLFETWESDVFIQSYMVHIENVAEYEPGNFYKRELPCILELLSMIQEEYDYIVLDGYVYLGYENKAGLGQHLWDALTVKKPIIGVAKNYFKDTPESCILMRGNSQKPLFITSIGMPLPQAKQHILQMYGKHRMPYLLKLVDSKTKETV